MTALGDRLRDPAAFRGAMGDLGNALRLTSDELAKITLAVAGQTPAQARQILADILRPAPVKEETTPVGHVSDKPPVSTRVDKPPPSSLLPNELDEMTIEFLRSSGALSDRDILGRRPRP
jgi:hypothetical protein